MRKLTLLTCISLLAGCATDSVYRDIIIDHQGVDYTQYGQDLYQCREYAKNVSIGGGAAAGAIGGAVLGAAFGAIFGNSDLAVQVASAGALYGAADGAAAGMRSKSDVVKNCMRGRGYSVLN